MQTARPPFTIGILGAGQLGLMLSHSLSNLGANVKMFDPSAQSPGARLTPFTTVAEFNDEAALSTFFQDCDRVTYEFEHIPTETLKRVLDKTLTHHKLWPSLTVLENAQNRIKEKRALAAAHAPLTPWVEIPNLDALESEKTHWLEKRRSAILKTAQGGYDGKGQWRLNDPQDWATTLTALHTKPNIFPLVLEEKCELVMELSVIVGRHPTLGACTLPAVENKHVNGILDTTYSPPRVPFEVCEDARRIAERIADVWDVFGLLTVEFFVVQDRGQMRLLVNEVAPRPHNSGHITRRSLTRSQFDVLAQILLDLPVQFQQIAPEEVWAMWNTLGDLWPETKPWWPAGLVAHGAVCEAMLYGKPDARPGRKMGHIILRAANHASIDKSINFFRTTFPVNKGHPL